MPVPDAISFSHHGLATTTLVLTLLTAATGFLLLGMRYGGSPPDRTGTVVRWAHVVLGVCMTVYVVATYYFVPF